MCQRAGLCPLIFCLAMLCASRAQAFEGVVDARVMTGAQTVVDMKATYGKTGDVRIDTTAKTPDGQTVRSSTIMPAKGESYYTLVHGQKIVVKMSYDALRKTSEAAGEAEAEANVEVKKLGKAQVSGMSTQHVRIIDKDSKAQFDLWMTDKYPADLWTRAFKGRGLGMDPGGEQRAEALRKYGIDPGFSLKMTVKDGDSPLVTFVVDRIEETSVPANSFALPTEYKRIEAPVQTESPQNSPASQSSTHAPSP